MKTESFGANYENAAAKTDEERMRRFDRTIDLFSD